MSNGFNSVFLVDIVFRFVYEDRIFVFLRVMSFGVCFRGWVFFRSVSFVLVILFCRYLLSVYWVEGIVLGIGGYGGD